MNISQKIGFLFAIIATLGVFCITGLGLLKHTGHNNAIKDYELSQALYNATVIYPAKNNTVVPITEPTSVDGSESDDKVEDNDNKKEVIDTIQVTLDNAIDNFAGHEEEHKKSVENSNRNAKPLSDEQDRREKVNDSKRTVNDTQGTTKNQESAGDKKLQNPERDNKTHGSSNTEPFNEDKKQFNKEADKVENNHHTPSAINPKSVNGGVYPIPEADHSLNRKNNNLNPQNHGANVGTSISDIATVALNKGLKFADKTFDTAFDAKDLLKKGALKLGNVVLDSIPTSHGSSTNEIPANPNVQGSAQNEKTLKTLGESQNSATLQPNNVGDEKSYTGLVPDITKSTDLPSKDIVYSYVSKSATSSDTIQKTNQEINESEGINNNQAKNTTILNNKIQPVVAPRGSSQDPDQPLQTTKMPPFTNLDQFKIISSEQNHTIESNTISPKQILPDNVASTETNASKTQLFSSTQDDDYPNDENSTQKELASSNNGSIPMLFGKQVTNATDSNGIIRQTQDIETDPVFIKIMNDRAPDRHSRKQEDEKRRKIALDAYYAQNNNTIGTSTTEANFANEEPTESITLSEKNDSKLQNMGAKGINQNETLDMKELNVVSNEDKFASRIGEGSEQTTTVHEKPKELTNSESIDSRLRAKYKTLGLMHKPWLNSRRHTKKGPGLYYDWLYKTFESYFDTPASAADEQLARKNDLEKKVANKHNVSATETGQNSNKIDSNSKKTEKNNDARKDIIKENEAIKDNDSTHDESLFDLLMEYALEICNSPIDDNFASSNEKMQYLERNYKILTHVLQDPKFFNTLGKNKVKRCIAKQDKYLYWINELASQMSNE